MNKQSGAAILAAWKQQEHAVLKCAQSGKHKYATLAECEKQREWLTRTTGTRGGVYLCRHCRTYHVTRQRPPNGDKSKFLRG